MSAVKKYLMQCRQFFLYAGAFSMVINLLSLLPAFYMLQMYDRVMPSHSNETLFMLTLLVVAMLALQYYLEYLRSSLLQRSSLTMQRLMQKSVLACMLAMPKQGRGNRRGLEDVQTIQSFVSGTGVQAVFEMPWIPVFFFVMFLFHPFLCLMAFVGAAVLFGLTYLEEKVSVEDQKEGQRLLRKSQDFMDSSLNNLEAINAMSMHRAISGRWYKVHDEALTRNLHSASKSASIVHWSKLFRNLLTVVVMAVAGYLAINDKTVTSGVMIAATVILGRIMMPIDRVISSWKSFIKAREAYSRLNEMLAGYDPEEEHFTLNDVSGHLNVEKLFFSQVPGHETLKGIHFSLAAGESLGIIGNSGAGKSTLTRLLVGLYKPLSGAVRLDGADIHTWAKTGNLGPFVGYLPQGVELFAGTVAENICRMDDPVANSEQVIAAAKLAGAHDFILRLPQGYDTDIGEGGRALSAGQRQLVGIARALFGSPKLIVLDEPNANLDGPSELAFMRMVRELKVRKITLVVISHKPSVLRDIDKVLVLEQGRQTAFGNRAEIMQKATQSIAPAPAGQLTEQVS